MDKETWLILLSAVLVAVGIITVSTLVYNAITALSSIGS